MIRINFKGSSAKIDLKGLFFCSSTMD
jgi:hypothetical protein